MAFCFRSDFADEVIDVEKETDFYKYKRVNKNGVEVCYVNILKYNKDLNKEIGDYVSININEIDDYNEREKISIILKDVLSEMVDKMIVKKDKHFLVVGLGNNQITADSLGPTVCTGVLATNHLFEKEKEKVKKGTGRVSLISPGVMGQTGVETSDIVKALAKEIKPDVVIVVDALCSRSIDRINRVIQISNTGISPGSGVGNRRKMISKSTIHIPVISIGVATVVDVNSILMETLNKIEKKGNLLINPKDREKIIYENENMIVTPKGIDEDISSLSSIIASGINMMAHKNIRKL